MLWIDNCLISNEVVTEKFCCNVEKCKGACCEDGDAGPRITNEEKLHIEKGFEIIKSDMSPDALEVVSQQGLYIEHPEFGWVTPTIPTGLCVYGKKDAKGIIQCLFEKAYKEDKIDWPKPLSCHLFPLKLSPSSLDPDILFLNYEPREDICKAACSFGKTLGKPVYEFVKIAIERKFGTDFYQALHIFAEQYNEIK